MTSSTRSARCGYLCGRSFKLCARDFNSIPRAYPCCLKGSRGHQEDMKQNNPQWYYLETEHEGGLRSFLKCRTFGLCMAHNRLLGFHVVRSTRSVVWTPGEFVPERSSRTPRTGFHIERHPEYPDRHSAERLVNSILIFSDLTIRSA